jgi:hypothetical protein
MENPFILLTPPFIATGRRVWEGEHRTQHLEYLSGLLANLTITTTISHPACSQQWNPNTYFDQF